MLNPPEPPAPKADEAPKRSEAVFKVDHLEKSPNSWTREITYFFEGEEYQYALEALTARTEEDARRVLYDPKPSKEAEAAFLKEVQLDMTRPH